MDVKFSQLSPAGALTGAEIVPIVRTPGQPALQTTVAAFGALGTYTPPFTGSVPTTVSSKLAQTVSVLDFGADPTGVADSTAAIQAAINAAATKGGGGVLALGTFAISSTINISSSNVQLIGYGSGGGDPQDVTSGSQSASQLKWIGASSPGVPMVSVFSPAGATLNDQSGMGVSGLQLNCNSLAGIGLLVTSVSKCLFANLYCANPITAAYKITTLQNGQLAVGTDSQNNMFQQLSWRCFDTTAAKAAHGIWTTSFNPTPGTNGNTSLNEFYDCVGANDGVAAGIGLFCEDSDNNLFFNFTARRLTGFSTPGIKFNGNPSCDSNHFVRFQVSGAGPIVVAGTASGFASNPTRNSFYMGDTQNAQVYPTLDAGCRVFWLDSNGVTQKSVHTSVVLGQAANISGALAQVANVTNESVRIFNSSNDHVVITNGTDTYGVSIDGSHNLRIQTVAGGNEVLVNAPLVSASTVTPISGGAVTCGVLASNSAGLGIFFGIGPPTFTAAEGAIYSNTSGAAGARLYVNTSSVSGTTWTAATSP